MAKSNVRIMGGMLLVFGAVLGGVGLLGLAGVIPLTIDFFGYNLDTLGERITWIIVWSLAVAGGAVLLRVRRHEPMW